MSEDQFWTRERELAELSVTLEADDLDIDSCVASRRCLGTSVSLESTAFVLLWTGSEQKALSLFDRIGELALVAYEHDETYVYAPVFGRNTFAKYMAMRIASTAKWIIGDVTWSTFADSMMFHLDEMVLASLNTPDNLGLGSATLGRYALHSVHLGRSMDIIRLRAVAERWVGDQSIWSRILVLLIETAGQVEPFPILPALEDLFAEARDWRRWGEVCHPDMTSNDLFLFAAALMTIRGLSLDGIGVARLVRSPAAS